MILVVMAKKIVIEEVGYRRGRQGSLGNQSEAFEDGGGRAKLDQEQQGDELRMK